MKYIERITIDNARRFGEKVVIDFGEGATILLAPNGVGKTTVFESIELALTGKIERIQSFPDAIINNKLSEMCVRLDFTGGSYSLVNYSKGNILNFEGNSNELLEIEENVSVPYLYKLTHYFEQHNKGWFIERNENDAGDLLSQLPLGKDLQLVLSKKLSVLRAISSLESSAENELKMAEEKSNSFNNLLSKRDKLATFGKLVPIEDIVNKINLISKLINYGEYKDEKNIAFVYMYFDKVKLILKQLIETYEKMMIKLSRLKERERVFSSNSELLKNKKCVILQHNKNLSDLAHYTEKTQKQLELEKEALIEITDNIYKLKKLELMFNTIDMKKSNVISKKNDIEINRNNLNEMSKSHKAISEYVKLINSNMDKHILINESINNEKIKLSKANFMKDLQLRWKALEEANRILVNEKIPKIEEEKNNLSKTKLLLDKSVFEAENIYNAKKSALNSLNNASSMIQEAVGNIRKNISENDRTCPVCHASYEHGELIKRIESSLTVLNPVVLRAISDEKNAQVAYEEAKKKQNDENNKIVSIINEIKQLYEELEANQKIILENIQPHFPGIQVPDEAMTLVEKTEIEIKTLLLDLENQKATLEPETAIEEINNATLRKNELERAINELNIKNLTIEHEIKIEEEEILRLSELLIDKEKSKVLENISSQTEEKDNRLQKINSLNLNLEKAESEVKKVQNILLSENEAISKLNEIQEVVISEWRQLEIEGEPNEIGLKSKYQEANQKLMIYINANNDLVEIELHLSSWRNYERLKDIDSDINEQIGNFSIESHVENLKKTLQEKICTLQNIKKKKDALNYFLTEVSYEADKIHEQLNSINYPWKRLLKRIVINPLISTAPLLSNANVRNKPLAKTSALIHDQNISITNIVSEAQLADLQLTLMLSMANKYKWTPWRALLLDDPTQHHDLVHASSVFDLLRDYIVNYNYQIMMSTHDSNQAKFFQNKLSNEGIISKVYQLVERKGGVTAERIS